ncbi:Uncharacterized iron-regulated protein [Roseovarius azorensis]|uniref:Uncharacterized iron-regulated protein n=1 Tax=Roseovarius azorensis TaxID=1287727 RepID=A0A1H7VQN8_9RHOB|nr:ChaN family lipoprotein [Roseovarius azorensis]SEM11612.1 Uncharacterized iron-regulated protein [Roseovarius azorensis]
MSLRCLAFVAVLGGAGAAVAQDVLILGEVHDNPVHHAMQAKRVAALQPRAIVFEMLTEAQATRVIPEARGDASALAEALDWDDSGWPAFSMYYPIFAAAPEAVIYGAHVPREAARGVFEGGLAEVFGAEAARYGLDRPLSASEQAAREAMQMAAHCDALPEDILPGMVAVQRLRDAMLARAVVQAVEATGGSVAVITGNGHARRDWGVPSYLAQVAPDLEVRVLGQTEEGRPLDGGFDEVVSAPAVDRPDPCAAFR